MGIKRLFGMVWPQLPEYLNNMDSVDSETLCEQANARLNRSSDTQQMLAQLKNCTILEKESADVPANCSYHYDTERLKRTQLKAKVSSLGQPGPNLTYPPGSTVRVQKFPVSTPATQCLSGFQAEFRKILVMARLWFLI